MTRHPATEGNELHPSDVIIPDPSGGDGRLSVRNDLAAEFAGLSISSTEPTDMPNGGVWVNLSAEPTGIDRLQTYDESTDAFIPISADRTIVSEEEPEPEIGLLWFEPVDDGANLYAANSVTWEFLQFITAIPDSVVSRPADNDTSGSPRERGIIISTTETWSEIQVEVSSNTASGVYDSLRVHEYDLENNDYIDTIATKDASDISSEDIVTIDLDEPIDDRNEFAITLFADGSSEDMGYYDSPDLPYVSSDGNLEIVEGAWADDLDDGDFTDDPGTRDDRVLGFVQVGNIDL